MLEGVASGEIGGVADGLRGVRGSSSVVGLGHTTSWHSGGLILLYLRSRDKPGGVISSGNSIEDGAQCSYFEESKEIFFSLLSEYSLTVAHPGVVLEKTR